MNFLNSHQNISDEEKRYLNHYATELYKNNVENLEHETLQDIFASPKFIMNNYQTLMIHQLQEKE